MEESAGEARASFGLSFLPHKNVPLSQLSSPDVLFAGLERREWKSSSDEKHEIFGIYKGVNLLVEGILYKCQ